jgi:hypothetical protein
MNNTDAITLLHRSSPQYHVLLLLLQAQQEATYRGIFTSMSPIHLHGTTVYVQEERAPSIRALLYEERRAATASTAGGYI